MHILYKLRNILENMSSKIKNKLMLDYPQEADINCIQCIQQEKDHTITKGINLHKKVLQFI